MTAIDWGWQYYEAATEALAVGIYLDATFVLEFAF